MTLFSACGLNATEETILTFLLQHGRSRASAIAQRTRIKRPTVYSALGSLEEQGLVFKQSVRGGTFFTALSKDNIPRAIQRRAKQSFDDLMRASQLLETALAKLPTNERYMLAGFEITSADSPDGVYELLAGALIQGDFCAIFNPQTALVGPLKKASDEYLVRSRTKRPNVREIIVSGPKADHWKREIKNPNHRIKEIECKRPIMSDMILVNNHVYLFDYEHSKELALCIRHTNYYSFMMMVFDMLWNSLPE